jgi:hypothetical protein
VVRHDGSVAGVGKIVFKIGDCSGGDVNIEISNLAIEVGLLNIPLVISIGP